MLTPEQALLLKIQQDQANELSMGDAALIGAGVGGAAGIAAGHPLHMVGKAINAQKDNLAAKQGLSRTPMMNFKQILKPGPRMAGGFLAAAATGALGAGIQALMTSGPSREAQMLGRLQAGTFTENDRYELANMLSNAYGKGIA